ncbi:hypothetical protein VTJ04DRAFT_2686 [Mycothermus thermophilus]|uniref:uncharacterized protein n=1 Tax=Humicola insolens TaxID=85995 RepID=UPI0037443BDF
MLISTGADLLGAKHDQANTAPPLPREPRRETAPSLHPRFPKTPTPAPTTGAEQTGSIKCPSVHPVPVGPGLSPALYSSRDSNGPPLRLYFTAMPAGVIAKSSIVPTTISSHRP